MNKHITLFLCSLITISFSATALDPKQILSRMTLEEKAAQLVIIAVISHEERNKERMEMFKQWADYDLTHDYAKELITKHKVGGVIFYGNNTLAAEQVALTRELQSLSTVPLLITLDAETSLSNRLNPKSVVTFPRAMTLGAIDDSTLVYKHGFELGRQLKKIGVHWTFSPVADVNCNPANPVIGWRSYGSDWDWVADHAVAFMQGLQDAGIIACAKHFPGHGDTGEDSHMTLPKITHNRHRLEYIELYPFKKLIGAGVKSIMLAHLEIPAFERREIPSCLSYAIVTTLLQQKMGFKGLIVTDSLGMKGVTDYATQEEIGVLSLEAGNHVILCPPKPLACINGIVKAVQKGRISQATLDAAVLKVLEAKAWAFAQHTPDYISLDRVLHSRTAYELKRELYYRAIILAKGKAELFNDGANNKIALMVGEKTAAYENTLSQFGVSHKALIKENTHDDIATLVHNYDHVIFNFHELRFTTKAAHDEYWKNMMTTIKMVKELKKVVTVIVFESPYEAQIFKSIDASIDALIIAHENQPDAQEAAAKIICNRHSAQGRMPV